MKLHKRNILHIFIVYMSKIKKRLLFGIEARNKLLKGINILADAVSSTLGPKGRNVAINNQHTYPEVYHDGVTIAKNINLEDDFEDMGAELVKEAAVKTVDTVGDGTTTATILTQAIVNEALKQIAAGINPMILKNEIEKDMVELIKHLLRLSKEINSDEEIEQIATISSTSKEIGKLVSDAIKKVGKDGVITVEPGKRLETYVDFKQGMEFDRGYLSPYFVTDNERVEAVIHTPYILITDKEIKWNNEFVPFLQNLLKVSKDLVIIASSVADEAMATCVVNRLKGNINVVAVQAPAYGGRRIDELEDIATLTGGTVILEDSGREIKTITIEELGRAEKFIADRDKSIILNGAGKKEAVNKKMAELREQIKMANTDYDKDIKEQRLAKLAGSVAVINVGAATETEMKEKKERVIDAVNATKAAVKDGIVAGGEITLYTLSEYANGILKSALKAPFRKLIENSGLDYAEVLRSMGNKKYPFGVDVRDGNIKDLIKAGIIDPTGVTESALTNAVSASLNIMTTDTLITDVEEKK